MAVKTTTKKSTGTKAKGAVAGRKSKAKPKAASTAVRKSPTKTKATRKASPSAETAVTKVAKDDVSAQQTALRKKDLIAEVMVKTGLKRGDVKKVIEATLSELGAALQQNRSMNIHPFGKIKIGRERKLAQGRVFVTRIRQNENTLSTDETDTNPPLQKV